MAEKLPRPRAVLEGLFNRYIANGTELLESVPNTPHNSPAIDKLVDAIQAWDKNVQTLLGNAFTGQGPADSYPTIFDRKKFIGSYSYTDDLERTQREISMRLSALKSISETLELFEDPSEISRVGRVSTPAPNLALLPFP